METKLLRPLLPEGCKVPVAPPAYAKISLFGFLATMQFAGIEFEGAGQIRYVISGARRLLAVPYKELRDGLGACGLEASSPARVVHTLRSIREKESMEVLASEKGVPFFCL